MYSALHPLGCYDTIHGTLPTTPSPGRNATFNVVKLNKQIGKNLAIYFGTAWVLMEASNFFIERYDLEPLLLDILILFLVFGIFGTITFSSFKGRWNKKAIAIQIVISVLGIASIVYFVTNPLTVNPRALRFIKIGGGNGPLENLESVAVLPIQNNLPGKENEYLVAGLHDGIITELGKMGTLKTISRTSTLPYSQSSKSLKQIGSELDVKTILESSLSPASNEYVYRARLLNAQSEELLWSDEFKANIEEFPKLYNDLSQIIATKLSPAPIEDLVISQEINPEAYEEILKGNHLLLKFSKKDLEQSIVHYKKAIELDSTSIEGYLGVAGAWIYMQQIGVVHPTIARPNIYYYGNKAVEIDGNHWNTLGHLSYRAFLIDYDLERGLELGEQSLALNPNNSLTRAGQAFNYMLTNNWDKAWEHMRYAKEIDPLNPQVLAFEAIMFMNDKKPLSGIKNIEKLSLIDKSSLFVRLTNVVKQRDFGSKKQAIENMKILYADATSDPGALNRFIDGEFERTNDVNLTWLAVLRHFPKTDFQLYYPSRVALVLFNFLQGYDDDLFFECLNQMVEDNCPTIPNYARKNGSPLQDDPRFEKIMKKVGLW